MKTATARGTQVSRDNVTRQIDLQAADDRAEAERKRPPNQSSRGCEPTARAAGAASGLHREPHPRQIPADQRHQRRKRVSPAAPASDGRTHKPAATSAALRAPLMISPMPAVRMSS